MAHHTKLLWDTDAQVLMVSREWHRRCLPNTPVRNVIEIFDMDLELSAANGTAIPFDGWIVVTVGVDADGMTRELQVPLLVTPKSLDEPIIMIIGYNVIKEVASNPQGFPTSHLPNTESFW